MNQTTKKPNLRLDFAFALRLAEPYQKPYQNLIKTPIQNPVKKPYQDTHSKTLSRHPFKTQ
jgi:hypothetical protein